MWLCCVDNLPGMCRRESRDDGVATFVACDYGKLVGLRVVEDGDCHNHAAFDGIVACNGVDSLGRGKFEDINLRNHLETFNEPGVSEVEKGAYSLRTQRIRHSYQ